MMFVLAFLCVVLEAAVYAFDEPSTDGLVLQALLELTKEAEARNTMAREQEDRVLRERAKAAIREQMTKPGDGGFKLDFADDSVVTICRRGEIGSLFDFSGWDLTCMVYTRCDPREIPKCPECAFRAIVKIVKIGEAHKTENENLVECWDLLPIVFVTATTLTVVLIALALVCLAFVLDSGGAINLCIFTYTSTMTAFVTIFVALPFCVHCVLSSSHQDDELLLAYFELSKQAGRRRKTHLKELIRTEMLNPHAEDREIRLTEPDVVKACGRGELGGLFVFSEWNLECTVYGNCSVDRYGDEDCHAESRISFVKKLNRRKPQLNKGCLFFLLFLLEH